MNSRLLNALRQALTTVAITALATGCGSDSSVAPEKAVDLKGCDNLRVPAGNTLEAHVYANGVQT